MNQQKDLNNSEEKNLDNVNEIIYSKKAGSKFNIDLVRLKNLKRKGTGSFKIKRRYLK